MRDYGLQKLYGRRYVTNLPYIGLRRVFQKYINKFENTNEGFLTSIFSIIDVINYIFTRDNLKDRKQVFLENLEPTANLNNINKV